jgi:membrane associated rhomboid family serine protease
MSILSNLENIVSSSQEYTPFLCEIIIFALIVNVLNWFSGSYLFLFGLRPRKIFGLIGIIFSPVLHGNFNHFFFNSIPFFALSLVLLGISKSLYIFTTFAVNLLECLLVWAFGRDRIHIGASGLVSGYFGFVLGLAYFQPTVVTIILAFIMLYYFGAILLGLFPSDDHTSWESHLSGFVAGIFLVYMLKYSTSFQQLYYEFNQLIA